MGKLAYDAARAVVRLSNRISTRRNADIKEMGLTAAQADALVYFAGHEGNSVTDLKSDMGVTHQTASGIVDRMIKKDLLATRVSEEDARCRMVFLTEQGKQLYACFLVNGSRVGDRMLDGLNETQQREFFALLTHAVNNLEAMDRDARGKSK